MTTSKGEVLVFYFHVFWDVCGMESIMTKVDKDLVQMEVIHFGFAGEMSLLTYMIFFTLSACWMNDHHWKSHWFTKAKHNVCNTHLRLTMGLWLCFLYLCFVKERRIWSKTFCCIIWELTKLEIPSFSEIFTNPNKTEQNCNQVKMTWLQMATFSRQIHEDSRIKAVVKSS